jgi:cyclohexanecarboxyl-CoA dehydrogenase
MNAPPGPVPADPIREEIARFARETDLAQRYRLRDREASYPREEFRQLGAAHLLGLSLPASQGGRGLDVGRAGRGLFELAYRGGTMAAKLSLQPEFSSVLVRAGSPELKERYFAPLLRGELLIGNQITEPHAGSDAAALALVARRAPGGYRLSGTKSQVAFAADADAAIVYARTGPGEGARGISAFLVPQATPGITRTVTLDYGERWMRRGTVVYHDVPVPEENRLGPEGGAFDLLKEELTHERALLGAVYLGVAWASFEETVAFVGERQAFGRRLSDQQAVAFPLVEDQVRLTAAWEFVARTLGRLERGEPVDGEAALAKWYSGQVALEAVDHALQFHGGQGYAEELPHAQRYRDLRSARVAHGTDEVMHVVAARRLWPRAPRPSPGKA